MEVLTSVLDFFLHVDQNLIKVVDMYGTLTYAILFFVVFMETGFVVTPFLPGDSLLFAAGAIAAASSLNIYIMYGILLGAAILGDTANYWLGHFIGPKVFVRDTGLVKKAYLVKAQKFYDKYGGYAIFLARFVPIVRTFAPFVAGIGKMNYTHFIGYNIAGAFVWVSAFLGAGYFFGNIPFVKHNFEVVVVAIVAISLLPIMWEAYKHKKNSRKASS